MRPLDPSEIRPVRICRTAWIGNSAHIIKSVTVGEGAIVAAKSVVTRDVPSFSLARGNPAQIGVGKYKRTTVPVAARWSLDQLLIDQKPIRESILTGLGSYQATWHTLIEP